MIPVIYNLREEILKEHSKAQCSKIVEWVGNNQKRFDELLQLFLHDDYRVTQRVGWPLSYCVTAQPVFIKKSIGALIGNLEKPGIHDAVKRNTIRLFQHIDIPKKYQGKLMDTCFRYVESPTEAVAIKAFSLTVLGKLAKLYPEILPEIKLLIEEQMPTQTPAFTSRAKHLLKTFGKS